MSGANLFGSKDCPQHEGRPFRLAVSMGLIPQYSVVNKFGANESITTGSDPEDIWEFGGLYPYDADGTAPIQYLSSTDNSDTQVVIVVGLDINGEEVQQSATLTGQTVVTLTTPLWRVYRMWNDDTTDMAGMVYCGTDSTPTTGVPGAGQTRALIENGNNQTQMAIYTIPKGYVGFLYRGEVGVEEEGNTASLAEYARFRYYSRRFGKVFRINKTITSIVGGGSSIYQEDRLFPDVIPSLTDLKLTVAEVSQTMGAYGTFDILLIEESEFSTEYLQAIGQPGY